MAKFLVDLKLQIGEYEKSTMHLIESETREQAMLQAMADESHGEANMDSCDGVWWDMGGEMAYCVRKCEPITDDIVKALTFTGCFHVRQFDPEQIVEMLSDDADTHDIDEMLSYL